jgi:signal transduction histidine kinase
MEFWDVKPPLAEVNWVLLIMFFFIFGGGGLIIEMLKNINKTRVEMAQLRAQQQLGNTNGSEIRELREEVRHLREELKGLQDTTTQYDISFDSALQRMERRVETIEQKERQQQIGIG